MGASYPLDSISTSSSLAVLLFQWIKFIQRSKRERHLLRRDGAWDVGGGGGVPFQNNVEILQSGKYRDFREQKLIHHHFYISLSFSLSLPLFLSLYSLSSLSSLSLALFPFSVESSSAMRIWSWGGVGRGWGVVWTFQYIANYGEFVGGSHL